MYGSEIERLALDQIEPELVRQGYRVVRSPSRADIPSFLQGYVPDAIALGKEPNIAVEIKGRQSVAASRSLSRIRKMFEGRDDWAFRVFYFDTLMPAIQTISTEALAKQRIEISELSKIHTQAAFILAWSFLEASLRESGLLDKDFSVGGPNKIIGILASEGYIEGNIVSELLELANKRNKIVHGQLDASVSTTDVERILALAEIVKNADLEDEAQ